jgi:antitoxin MazE
LTRQSGNSIINVDTVRRGGDVMKTKVQRWGNSLALRIPKTFAREAGLCEHTAVDLSLVEGKLIIQPQAEEFLRLGDLLRGVTDENLHREWDTGQAVGKEIW